MINKNIVFTLSVDICEKRFGSVAVAGTVVDVDPRFDWPSPNDGTHSLSLDL